MPLRAGDHLADDHQDQRQRRGWCAGRRRSAARRPAGRRSAAGRAGRCGRRVVVSSSVGSTPATPSIALSRIGNTQTTAIRKIFASFSTPSTRIANGISAGAGIARRNSMIGVAMRRSVGCCPSSDAERDAEHDGDHVARGRAGRRLGSDVLAEALEQPGVGERGEDVAERRVVVAAPRSRSRPTARATHQQRRDDLDAISSFATAHATAARCEGCQCSTRRSPRGEQRVQAPAEQAGGDDQRVHHVHRAALAGDVDLAPEARRADDQLGGDGEDQRGRGRDPQAGGDVGHRAHQRHAQDAVLAADAERARGLQRDRVEVAGAVDGLDQQRPDRTRTRPGRPCSAARCRRRGSRAGSAPPTGPGAGTRSRAGTRGRGTR